MLKMSEPSSLMTMRENEELLNIDDYFKLDVWSQTNEFGVRIGYPVLSFAISNIPTTYETNTEYNKRKAYDFSYNGVNEENREIKIKFKFNIRKYENNPIGGGRYQTLNQDYKIKATIGLGVENKSFTYHTRIRDVDSGFPQGILGWIIEMFDITYRILGYIIDQEDPGKLTDTIISAAAGIITGGQAAEVIRTENECINEFIKNEIIYPSDVRFDDKGIWFIFNYKQTSIQEIIKLINSGSCN